MNLLSLLIRPVLNYWSRKARPCRGGEVSIPGVNHPVEVRWDGFAVPHILARSEADLFAAQGYVHAQERLWQMDLSRRFFSGRLSEIFGDRTLPFQDFTRHLKKSSTAELDYFMRVMGIHDTASRSLALLAEAPAGSLDAYCNGVNAYMEKHRRRLPVEFRLLRYEPTPWLPEDCLTVVKGFALLLSPAFLTRVVFTAIADRLRDDPGKLSSLAPSAPEWPSITRVHTGDHPHEAVRLLRFLSGTFVDGPWCPSGQGSNSWVLSGNRGVDGHPWLCNDPHLRLTLPCVWYLNHIRVIDTEPHREFAAWGASVPGSPYVYIGHNQRIAWGITAALCDDADLFHEQVNPEKPDLYRGAHGWEPFERRSESFTVRGRGEIVREVRFTRHGPVLSDVLRSTGSGTPGRSTAGDPVLALKWTGHMPADEMRSVRGINRAHTWPEFLDSLSHHVAPSLNYVYADVEGNIGYTLAGKIPLRPRRPTWLPLPGWTGEHAWSGYIPFQELPRLYNPPEGVIATANNRIADHTYPYYLSDLFEPPHRIQRLRALLAGKDRLGREDMASIQRDTRSLQSTAVLGALESDLRHIRSSDQSLAEALDLLLEWDGDCSRESPAAGFFHVFYMRLMWNIWGNDLGEELFTAYTEILNQPVNPLRSILEDPASEWFAERSLREIVWTSLREARSRLAQELGRNPRNWAWGKLHTLRLRHGLGNRETLASYFSLGPFPSAGDGSTINNAHYRYSMPYEQTIGPSLRLVIELEHPIRSHAILSGGQSGHARSSHYRDQIALWRRGDYIQLAHPEREMKDWPLLTLRPRGAHPV